MTEAAAHPRVNISQVGGVDVGTGALPVTGDVDMNKVGGVAVAPTLAGAMPVQGTQGNNTPLDASAPVQVGAGVLDVLVALTVGRLWRLLVDGFGRLWSRDSWMTLSGPSRCFSAAGPGFGGKALTVNFADSSGDVWIAIPQSTRRITFRLTTTLTAPTALEVMPWYSPDGGVTAVALPATISVVGGAETIAPLYAEVKGQDGAATLPNGSYSYPLERSCFPSNATHIKLQGRREGGAADTALEAYVVFEG